MEVGGLTLLKRLGWIALDGRILVHFYPVFPPDGHARIMLAWLQAHRPEP
jgi:peroxiredoxin